MVLIRLVSALAAASILSGAMADDTPSQTIKNPMTTPTVLVGAKTLVDVGCYQDGTPLENHGPYTYQSPGNCQLVCLQLNKNVMGTSDGLDCWCGDKIPALSNRKDNSTCDTPCGGDNRVKCGGPALLWVQLTGATLNRVDTYDPKSSSSSSTKISTSTSTAVPVASASSAPSEAAPQESKPNTAGIAAGVVVGIVGLGAMIGGVFFFLRRRRQKQAEDDYRRNAANVDSFVSGGKLHTSNSSMNDSRLEPSFMDRRTSNGSIADNEDYSRRILKVTNV